MLKKSPFQPSVDSRYTQVGPNLTSVQVWLTHHEDIDGVPENGEGGADDQDGKDEGADGKYILCSSIFSSRGMAEKRVCRGEGGKEEPIDQFWLYP